MILLLAKLLLLAPPIPLEPEAITREHVGALIVVEDKVSSLLGSGINRQLRLRRNTDINFRFEDLDIEDDAENVRVVGTLRFQAGKLVVDVTSVEVLPSDLEQYQARATQLKPDDFLGWYALADWARARGKQYGVTSLEEKAKEAYRAGLTRERTKAKDNLVSLEDLRARMTTQDYLKDVDISELDHALLRARWTASNSTGAPALHDFAQLLRDTLAGNRRAFPLPPAEALRAKYQSEPVTTFAAATKDERAQLIRAWEVELLVAWATARQTKGEWTWEEAADWAAENLPDYRDYERNWLHHALADATKTPVELSKTEIEKWSDLWRDRLGNAPNADQFKRDWLVKRVEILLVNEESAIASAKIAGRPLPARDARSRHEFAEIWREWFPNDPAGPKLLLDALRIEPTFEAAADSLRALGYRREANGTWLTPEQAEASPDANESPRALSIGMNPREIETILGKPARQARLITAPRRAQTQWLYPSPEETLVISFESDGITPTRVSAILHVPANK